MSHRTGRRHRTNRRHGRLLRLAFFAALAAVVMRRLRGRNLREHFARAHHGHEMDAHHY